MPRKSIDLHMIICWSLRQRGYTSIWHGEMVTLLGVYTQCLLRECTLGVFLERELDLNFSIHDICTSDLKTSDQWRRAWQGSRGPIYGGLAYIWPIHGGLAGSGQLATGSQTPRPPDVPSPGRELSLNTN